LEAENDKDNGSEQSPHEEKQVRALANTLMPVQGTGSNSHTQPAAQPPGVGNEKAAPNGRVKGKRHR
jgi:hypothetical protein